MFQKDEKEMSAIPCSLCNRTLECVVREIDGMEYDICPECWNDLVRKLKGKGRPAKHDIVIVSPPERKQEPEEEPPPGLPPKIWLSKSVN
jgi:ribosome-binding protein aMBF1 (putative translation factor)